MTQARDFADLLNASSKIDVNKLADTAVHGRRNLIINGAMQVAQRGTSSSAGNGFAVDRFTNPVSQSSKLTVQQNAGSVTPPAGFQYYYGMTSSSAYTPISTDYFYVGQNIEGYNVAHLEWGTANAKTVTLSFWVRSSLTGTFGGSIQNSAQNRSYPFSYAISSANTWEYKTVTIAGDTTGTWLKTNGKGAVLWFSVGAGSNNKGTAGAWAAASYASVTGAVDVVGTSGATWYITGVQLEVGSQATSFEHRSYGEEIILCYRYYQQISASDRIPVSVAQADNVMSKNLLLFSPMRAQPSLSTSGAYDFDEYYVAGRTQTTAQIVRQSGNEQVVVARFPNWSGMTDGNRGNPGVIYNAITRIDAEL